jgi:hypothetical protein
MASKRKLGSKTPNGSDQEKKTLRSFICVLQTGERVSVDAENVRQAMKLVEIEYKPLIVIATHEKN